jgi:hypothetical protein
MNGNSGSADGGAQHQNVDHPTVSRRRFLGKTAAVGTAAYVMGTGAVAAQEDEEYIDDSEELNFDSDLVHDPWINATTTITDVDADMGTLQYYADDDTVEDLTERGFALARDPDDEDTVNNPVSLMATDLDTTEFTAFPRGATYDDDADSSTDEVPVEWHDKTHWTTDASGGGSISLTDVSGDALQISTSSQTDSDTVTATLDLSTIASEDVTITDGVARKILQMVVDVDTLEAGSTVEWAIIASDDTEVTATFDPDGDAGANVADLLTSTGDSQVVEVRVGDLEDAQSKDLPDIEQVEVRVKDANADVTLHALNLERSSEWVFGTEEYQTTNNDGETVVETQDLTEPSGTFSIVDLESLRSGSFGGASIDSVTYDSEMRASRLGANLRHVRVKDSPETYDRPKVLEAVYEFDVPTAYALDFSFSNLKDVVQLAQTRYLAMETATGISEISEWSDVEDSISWTSRTSTYDTVDEEIELQASVSSADTNAVRTRTLHSQDEIDAMTSSGAVGAVGVSGGGGGGGLLSSTGGLLTVAIGSIIGLGAWFRKSIFGALGD